METSFAKVPQDLRDDGVERVVWPRDGDIVGMGRGSLEVVDSLCIAIVTAIALVASRSRGFATTYLLKVGIAHAHRCAIVVNRRRLTGLCCTTRGFVSFPGQLLAFARTV